jgi:hypothetical protein
LYSPTSGAASRRCPVGRLRTAYPAAPSAYPAAESLPRPGRSAAVLRRAATGDLPYSRPTLQSAYPTGPTLQDLPYTRPTLHSTSTRAPSAPGPPPGPRAPPTRCQEACRRTRTRLESACQPARESGGSRSIFGNPHTKRAGGSGRYARDGPRERGWAQ